MPVRPRTPRQRSEALKERVYITSTALAVTVAYGQTAGNPTVAGAAVTLCATVLGTLLSVFVADVVTHLVRENVLPSGAELAHLGYVSLGSSTVLVVPMSILWISAAGVIAPATALRAISAALAATLVVVTAVAVRDLDMTPWRKAQAVAIISALGLAGIGIELAVH